MARDIYSEVTDRIVAALDAGVAPWVRPWSAAGEHRNAVSGREYSGVNILLLTLTALERGYADPRWMTFNQARAAGGCVRKGEKGTLVVYFRIHERDERGADGVVRRVKRPLLRHFTVFNVCQVDGLDLEAVAELDAAAPNGAQVLERLQADGCTLSWGGAHACYVPGSDSILLPQPSAFVDFGAYWATALHEAVHATGAPARCARDLSGRFRSEAYAAEELVAELGSAFLCTRLGIDGKLQHPEYIGAWLKVLRGDKYALFTAARLAREACAWLLPAAAAEADEEASDEATAATA